jgi:formate hydrogenlyase transcriptional activator
MDGENHREERATPSSLIVPWDSVRTLFEHAPDALFLLDPERETILDVNPASCRLLEASREDLLSRPLHAIWPNEMPRFRAFARSVLEAGSGRLSDLACVTQTRHTVLATVSASVVNIEGRPCLMVFVRESGESRGAEPAATHDAGDLKPGIESSPAEPAPPRERHGVLLEINNAIISNLSRESLFRAITEALRQIVPFDRAVLPLYDPEKDVFQTFALEGPVLPGHVHDVHTEIRRQGTGAGWVLDHRRPLLKRDLEVERELAADEMLLAGGIHAYMIVPLIARGRILGALFLGSSAPNRYSTEDVGFLEEVGHQIALAIENMLAYEEIGRLRARLEEENRYLQEEIKTEHNFEEIIGQSPVITRVFEAIETVAPTDATVLIVGETGTGKELVARALHNLSPRRRQALVKVNCAALPAGLVESELFGHEKGAFTGALARRQGRFELAHGGTLFLDEIGDLSLELQPKLLRVLQEGEFERVGSPQTISVDVRVLAASNRDLEQAIQAGGFRADLYYRLSVFPIRVPPLRERTEDIPFLVRYFTHRYATRLGKRIPSVPAPAMETLQAYAWPGNVRELENVIERAVILSRGPDLDLSGWLPTSGTSPRGGRIRTLEELEREHIVAVLEVTGWRVSGARGAATLLGMKPTTLEARMRKLGIRRQ